jgi:hypothetical protein
MDDADPTEDTDASRSPAERPRRKEAGALFSGTAIEMAERHVREAQDRVANQRRRVRQLSEDGYPTAVSTLLLAEFERSFRLHLRELERLRRR